MPSEQSTDQATPGHESPLETAIKLGLVALLILLCFQIIAPFLMPVMWGVILAISLYSAFAHLSSWLAGRQKLAAGLITVLALVLFIGPVGMLASRLVDNMQDLATQLQSGAFKIPAPPEAVADWPVIGKPLNRVWSLAATDPEEALTKAGPQLKIVSRWLLDLAAGLGGGFVQFLLAVVIAGLLLPHSESGRRAVCTFADKVTNRNGIYFVDLAGATIRNVALGVMGVALLQGLLSGMAFLVVDVPAAGLLAFLVLLLSALQVGPAIVIVPIIFYVLMSADILSAVLFMVWIIPVMLLDNILKPILVSRGLDTPMIVIFVGVIGGTLSFGIVGLFVGPVTLGIGYKLLVEWTKGMGGERRI